MDKSDWNAAWVLMGDPTATIPAPIIEIAHRIGIAQDYNEKALRADLKAVAVVAKSLGELRGKLVAGGDLCRRESFLSTEQWTTLREALARPGVVALLEGVKDAI